MDAKTVLQLDFIAALTLPHNALIFVEIKKLIWMLDSFVIMEIQLMRMDVQMNAGSIRDGNVPLKVLNNPFVLQYVEMVRLMEVNF